MIYPQATRPVVKILAAFIYFSLSCNLPLCAPNASAQQPDSTSKPRITGIQLRSIEKPLESTPTTTPSPATTGDQSSTGKKPAEAPAEPLKKIIPFVLEIAGEGFGTSKDAVTLNLNDRGLKTAIPAEGIKLLTDKSLIITGQAAPGTYDIELSISGKPADNAPGLKIKLELPPEEKTGVKNFEVKFNSYLNKSYANSYTMVITNEDNAFDLNPNRMQIQIIPNDPTNVHIEYNDTRQIVLNFMAPDKFEAKDVVVIVYDSSNLDTRQAKYVSGQSKKNDPNQPTIKNTELVFLDRSRGFGRLKIEGTGFGHDSLRQMESENYLTCCALRRQLTLLEELYAKPELSKSERKELETEIKEAREDWSTLGGNLKCDQSISAWDDWTAKVNQDVKVILVPRNPTFRLDKVQVIGINDKLMDVYFEFATIPGYSLPFRLSGVALTITKPAVSNVQTLSEKDKKATGTILGPGTFIASASLGDAKSPNLQYFYALLDKRSVLPLFGRGVANNFYVIQLSVSNIGPKKIAIPLSSIKAEVEWANFSKVTTKKHLPLTSIPIPRTGQDWVAREGPANIPPVPLSSVAGYFDAYNKAYGKRAILLNVLTGLSTLMTPFTAIFGPGFTDAQNPFNAGVIPFFRTVFPDMSSEQLQRLASESWSEVESLSAGGGHITKYIFIPKGGISFSTPSKDNFGLPVAKQIKDIVGLDVIGFEITEGATIQATEANQTTPIP